jgi:hypothetical protein
MKQGKRSNDDKEGNGGIETLQNNMKEEEVEVAEGNQNEEKDTGRDEKETEES